MFGLTPFNSRRNGVMRRNGFWDIRDFMDSFFNDPFFQGNSGIRADIRETDKEYIVDAEIPGVNKEDINIELNNDRLTIAVERNEEVNVEKENYIRRERRSGSFCRSFYIENVVEDQISAKFENGVLSIVLPKKDQTPKKRNRIEIK